MNRQRKTNRGLPRRVYVKFGAYYFVAAEPIRVSKTGEMKKWVRLCAIEDGESKMLMALAALIGGKSAIEGSMPHLCAEFKIEKLGKYSKDVQAAYSQYLDVIADEFEDFHVAQVTTKEFADFLRDRFRDKPNTAQKYAALARKLFKHAVSRLGLRKDNPIDQLDLGDFETERRTVLPTHAQVAAIRAAGMMSKARSDTGKTLPTASGPMFACLIDMAYLLWARAADVRTLKESQIENGRIRITPTKTQKTSGKTVDILITPAIQEVLNRARAIKATYKVRGHPLITAYLFPTQKGQPYTKSGLFSMWDRARERAGITEAIWYKDLRALGATDAAKAGNAMSAIQTRLAHTSSKTSEIYIKESVPESSEIVSKLPWKSI